MNVLIILFKIYVVTGFVVASKLYFQIIVPGAKQKGLKISFFGSTLYFIITTALWPIFAIMLHLKNSAEKRLIRMKQNAESFRKLVKENPEFAAHLKQEINDIIDGKNEPEIENKESAKPEEVKN